MFKKLGLIIHRSDIESIISNNPGSIERVLYMVYSKIINFQQGGSQSQSMSIANKLSELSNGINVDQVHERSPNKLN